MTLSKNSRNFILTVNEKSLKHYDEIYKYLTSLAHFNYILVTEHFGQENKHYHIYVQYNRTKQLCIEKLFGSHLEKCFGSAQQNSDYCKALDDKHKKLGVTATVIVEEGEMTKKGGNWTIKRLRECDDEDEIPAHLFRIKRQLVQEDVVDIDIDDVYKNIKVYWIQGPSGVGKTNKAKEIIKNNVDKFGNHFNMISFDGSFYHGVGKAKAAIYDDFRDSHMKPSEFIHLIDYNKHFLNVKGSSKLNDYELLIFTSIQNLSDIYKRVDYEEPRKQWERRIEVIDMNPPEAVNIGGKQIAYKTNFNQLEEYEVTKDWESKYKSKGKEPANGKCINCNLNFSIDCLCKECLNESCKPCKYCLCKNNNY